MTRTLARVVTAGCRLGLGCLFFCSASLCWAQPGAFSYQGKLTDAGNPANGSYDLQFKLFDNATIGLGTQYGGTVVVNPVVASAGLFTATLNFGAAAFGATGLEVPDLYLEIGVRPAGSAVAYTTVSPRQKILSSPYAIEAISATHLGGVPANRFVQSDINGNVGLGTNPTGNGRLEVLSFGGSATYSECPSCTGVYGKSTSGVAVFGTSSSGNGVYGLSNSFEGVRGETQSAGSAGVVGYNLSSGGFGVFGSSPGGAGVQGNSTSGTGVVGGSSGGSGVYGESAFPNSLTAAGVYGVGTGAGSIGVHGTSNNANAVGVFADSTSAQGYGVYARAFNGRAIWADGHAGQARAYGGIAKAMVRVLDNSTISQCYNSQLVGAASATVPCGFTVGRFCVGVITNTCVTRVNFGFQVSDRFWATSIQGTTNGDTNRGINVSAYDSTTLGVSMFVVNDATGTDYATPFMLIVY